MRKNYEEISLQSDVFEAARKDFDRLLQKLFRTMENNESKEAVSLLKSMSRRRKPRHGTNTEFILKLTSRRSNMLSRLPSRSKIRRMVRKTPE